MLHSKQINGNSTKLCYTIINNGSLSVVCRTAFIEIYGLTNWYLDGVISSIKRSEGPSL